jgi:hypothetical protein
MKPTIIKVGGVRACMWEDERGGKSVSVERTYYDKAANEWKQSKYYKLNDIPKLILALQKAYEAMACMPESDGQ